MFAGAEVVVLPALLHPHLCHGSLRGSGTQTSQVHFLQRGQSWLAKLTVTVDCCWQREEEEYWERRPMQESKDVSEIFFVDSMSAKIRN